MKLSNIKFAQLRALVAVEETGSFTLAAERLGRTQSAISHTVLQLEQEFDTPLFVRQRHGALVTAAGRLAVKEARMALLHLARLEYVVKGEAALQTGRLNLGCFASSVNWGLGRAITIFARRYPAVDLSIVELADDSALTALRERKVDLAMVNLPCVHLSTFPLFEDELCIVISKELAAMEGDKLNLEQLAQLPFIYPEGACSPLIEAAFQAAGSRPIVKVRMTTHGATMILGLVREGAGFSILPTYALASEQLLDLRVSPLYPRILRRVAFGMESKHSLSPAAKAFLRIVGALQASNKLEEL